MFKKRKIESFKNSSVFNSIMRIFLKSLGTFFLIGAISFTAILINIILYIVSVAIDSHQNRIPYDLKANKLNLTSIVYVSDGHGGFREYTGIHGEENRLWVDFDKIPKAMKDAIIAIEDKRFYGHNGIDFKRTFGAIKSLVFGRENAYGGSTITQQTIKNLSDDNKISLTRKIREIFRSFNLEKDYSKDDILETYLNVVNFGGGSRGVGAASRIYFGKEIWECSLIECVTIAGITQNPYAYSPLVYPENNKKRREIVLFAMKEQGKLTQAEYEAAKLESDNMKFNFVKNKEESQEDSFIYNWYIEAMLNDIQKDLRERCGIKRELAEDMIYKQGLKIYCAMDEKAQNIAESVIKDKTLMPKDEDLEMGYVMIDPADGHVLASIGSRKEKAGNLVFDRASSAKRQPGSSFKPLGVYAPAIDRGPFHYSFMVSNQKIPNYFDGGRAGPNNWSGSDTARNLPLCYCIEHSVNVPAANIMRSIGVENSINFLGKLGFSLKDKDKHLALALGGVHEGVTVREMTAAYQIFGSRKNIGVYHKPYTYYLVQDREGRTLLDNTNNPLSQVITKDAGLIMNRLLRNAIIGTHALGKTADIPGWEVIGKTGTTENNKDYWFMGSTPCACAGIWYGYDDPKPTTRENRENAKDIWRIIMERYLEGKRVEQFFLDYQNIVSCEYCSQSGGIAGPSCPKGGKGYYSRDNTPEMCSVHSHSKRTQENNDPSNDSHQNENHQENVPNNEFSETIIEIPNLFN